MMSEVSPAAKVDDEKSIITKKITELSEDIEVVSPGSMLREARTALSLSEAHIAKKLNFKIGLVKNIENDIFSPSIPVTFNRGYLANYAKLVGVDVVNVLASYDALDAANIQRTELLSFSKETTKQAEHSRVMWLSYLIVAVLVGLTILWWLQESSQQASNSTSFLSNTLNSEIEPVSSNAATQSTELNVINETPTLINNDGVLIEDTLVVKIEAEKITIKASATLSDNIKNDVTQVKEPTISTAIFTFNGDCWVNIFDATGERIAWGVKKGGYVMTIQGKAPLRITVGKPELTSIVFNGKAVDMSVFNVGNIAKFNLPIVE
jgi:cytoskeleton protein RodZ